MSNPEDNKINPAPTVTASDLTEKAKTIASPVKKAVDKGFLPSNVADQLVNSSNRTKEALASGTGGNKMIEPLLDFVKTESEKCFVQGGSSIVLGRDRPASRLSGYGGKGHTQAASIDMVVGRLGHEGNKAVDPTSGKTLAADPNFALDSARIYISQKTDIDGNFGLRASPGAAPTDNNSPKSGIGIKADTVRIIARENIRLATISSGKNSQGGAVDTIQGIDLVAGNTDDTGPKGIQPMVKGNNLVACLVEIVKSIDQLNGIVAGMLQYQNALNKKITSHYHHSPFYGLATSPSPGLISQGPRTMMQHLSKTKMSLVAHKQSLAMTELMFLEAHNDNYINSRHNNTN